jgi:hypothetical protein
MPLATPITERPPAIRTFGPRELGLRKGPERRVGPGAPPNGFVRPTTSAEEWIGYWAIATTFMDPDPEHVRQPPFFGGLDWGYQVGDREIGGGVFDYVVYLPGEILGVRLVGEFFHGEAGPVKEQADVEQALTFSRFMTVKDWYAQDFIGDASGASAVSSFIELIGGRSRLPLTVRFRRSKIGTF